MTDRTSPFRGCGTSARREPDIGSTAIINRRTRIAMLTPSSNTVVEPYTSAILAPLAPDVSVHFGTLSREDDRS